MTTSSFFSPAEAGACSEEGEFKGEEETRHLLSVLGAVGVVRYGKGATTILAPRAVLAVLKSGDKGGLRKEEWAGVRESLRGGEAVGRSWNDLGIACLDFSAVERRSACVGVGTAPMLCAAIAVLEILQG